MDAGFIYPNSTFPPFTSFADRATSSVTDPVFGGHQASGAQTFPSRPTDFIISGGGDHGIELQPTALDLPHQVVASHFVRPASPGFADLVAGGNHNHAFRFPQTVRKHHAVPRTIWSACLRINPQAYRNFHRLIELGKGCFLTSGMASA